jgi:hypothetical protein
VLTAAFAVRLILVGTDRLLGAVELRKASKRALIHWESVGGKIGLADSENAELSRTHAPREKSLSRCTIRTIEGKTIEGKKPCQERVESAKRQAQ